MPRIFASKVFTMKLFPRNARWEFDDPLPAHRSRVVWLLWGSRLYCRSAVSALCYSYFSFSTPYCLLLRYLKRPFHLNAVNRSVESTVVKRRHSRYNRYTYQNSLLLGTVTKYGLNWTEGSRLISKGGHETLCCQATEC